MVAFGPSVPTGSSVIASDVIGVTTTVYGSKPTCITVSVSPTASPSMQNAPSPSVREVRTPFRTAVISAPATTPPRESRTLPQVAARPVSLRASALSSLGGAALKSDLLAPHVPMLWPRAVSMASALWCDAVGAGADFAAGGG